MKFLTFAFGLLFISCTLIAGDTTSMSGKMFRYSIGVQMGQPNQIAGADVLNGSQPFSALHGNLDRFSIGTGGFFRWHIDETFSLHARFSYSTRRYSLYDSVVDPKLVEISPNWTNTIARSYVADNSYRMNNILIGIGGGHEGHYGKFIVRAGGEIDFIKYSDVIVQTESRTYIFTDSDTNSTGGNYNTEQRIFNHDLTTSPGLWAIGIVGHASLEYKVTPHWGIGANIYLGGFYCGTRNAVWRQEVNSLNSYTDSHGLNNQYSVETNNAYPYSVNQFDFSPLNGQINVVYYFSIRYSRRGSF